MTRARCVTVLLAAGLAGIVSCGAGCSQYEPFPGGAYRVRSLGKCDWHQAFAAAVSAVSEHFRIDVADEDTGLVKSEPSEFTQDGRRMRRCATVRLRRQDGQVVVACRVQIQRLATASARAWARQRSAEDSPFAMQPDEDIALTAEQSEYWADVGRDYALERQILTQIARAFEHTATRPVAEGRRR